jgi:hypothetical protein
LTRGTLTRRAGRGDVSRWTGEVEVCRRLRHRLGLGLRLGRGRWSRGWLGRLPQPPPVRGGGLQGLGHQVEGTVLGPGGAVAGFGVRFELLTGGLHAQPQPTVRLARHAVGLSEAFQFAQQRDFGLSCEAVAGHRLLGGGDVEHGKFGLGQVGRTECGDLGDGGLVSQGELFGAVGGRGREPAAQCVDEVVVSVARDLGAEGLVRRGGGHGGDYSTGSLIALPINVMLHFALACGNVVRWTAQVLCPGTWWTSDTTSHRHGAVRSPTVRRSPRRRSILEENIAGGEGRRLS